MQLVRSMFSLWTTVGLVNEVCGQLFAVLAGQVLSPLTITPRVSVCSSALPSANENTCSHNT